LVTASELSLWGLSSVLWGLIAGSLILFLQKVFQTSSQNKVKKG